VRRNRLALVAAPLAAAALLAPSGSAATRPKVAFTDVMRPGFQGEDSDAPGDRDARPGSLAPTAVQQRAAAGLGAKARWNQFGTPRSLFNRTGYLSGPRPGADPVAVARDWVRAHAGLFRLDAAETAALRLVANNALYESPDNRRMMHGLKPLARDADLPHVVLFHQSFGGVEAGNDGQLTVGLDRSNRVTYVSSSVTGDTRVTNTERLGLADAWRVAAADIGWALPKGTAINVLDGVKAGPLNVLQVAGVKDRQYGRLVALPTPRDGVRLAFEVDVMDNSHLGDTGHFASGEPVGYVSWVDAETGKVLLRQNSVDHFSAGGLPAQVPLPDPRWKIFPHTPQLAEVGVQAADTRQVFCWVEGTGCDLVIGGTTGFRARPQLKFPYDEVPDSPDTATPSFTSTGNDADTSTSFASHLTPDSPRRAAPQVMRDYTYPFTDQWHTSNCNLSANYASPQLNDADAAIINLFVNYGRMHDWSYYLGFRESTWNMQATNFGEDEGAGGTGHDPELGQAQAGAVAGSVVFTGRDNANQVTQQDGVPGVTNQYLWHPLQASFYSPCVDGAFDMTVVGHEYTHAISNRMIGGPTANIGGSEGPKMGESWSDLAAMEYVNGYGFAPVGTENRYAVGPYATGNKERGIRNYGMNFSPLDYSDLNYDGNGATSPHADGEIWSAANFAVRQALVAKYDAAFPSTDAALQFACADGLKPSTQCPGNRRWIQLMFDGFLLQEAAAGMPAAAEAQMAGDKMRYNGANQKELWAAYASRGMGDGSEDGGTPSWATPMETNEASVTFQAVPVDGGGVPKELWVHVGDYTARTTEATLAKDGDPSPGVLFVPGTYTFTARGDGYGSYRFTRTFKAGESVNVQVPMRKNLASVTNGGDATGDGGNFEALIDDTEETNWAFLGETNAETIEGKQVTVDLAGGASVVKEVAVSAINRPQNQNDPHDAIGQNRFAALRSFEILTCDATTGADCEDAASFTKIYTSPEDAFPTGRPRPLSPNLLLRTFDVPDTKATHVRLRVLTNQCTGNPIYTIEENPVGEPLSNPDCVDGFTAATLVDTDPDPDDPPPLANNTQRHRVRAAELQVFSSVTPGGVTRPVPPVVKPPVVKPPVAKPPVAKPPANLPATGAPLPLALAAVLVATASALALRRQRTA
jgi:extracellular elastinolytic metalloproteinase